MTTGFTFNSIHSLTKNIRAVKAPRAIVPERRTEIIDIPFKTEAYVIPDESYKPEIIEVQCFVELNSKSIFQLGREWTTWLHQNTWKDLVFDDDPTFTYKAMCITNIKPDDLRSPIVTIKFHCTRVEEDEEE